MGNFKYIIECFGNFPSLLKEFSVPPATIFATSIIQAKSQSPSIMEYSLTFQTS